MPLKIRLLRDRVLVRPLTYEHPTLYVAGIELRKGEVIAVGPGRRVKRKIPWKIPSDSPYVRGQTVNPGQTFLVEDGPETGEIRPVCVKPGDFIEYGFRDCFEFYDEGQKFLIIKAQNIYGTTNGDRSEGLLEPKSAEID